jgi:hypothetical protein
MDLDRSQFQQQKLAKWLMTAFSMALSLGMEIHFMRLQALTLHMFTAGGQIPHRVYIHRTRIS